MILDSADSIEDGESVTAEVCIVGGGAAGIALAVALMNAGIDVVVLEGSIRDDPRVSARGDGPSFQDNHAQCIYHGQVSGEIAELGPTFLHESRVRGFGGTTNCWGGWLRPLDSIDFGKRLGCQHDGWPIDKDELDYYYERAMEFCTLRRASDMSLFDRPSYWTDTFPDKDIGVIADEVNVVTRMTQVMPQWAWNFHMSVGLPLRESQSVRVLRNAHVMRLSYETSLSYASVKCASVRTMVGPVPGPKQFSVYADHFVLALGGLETPRLLLLSELDQVASGIGECLMVHPLVHEGAWFTRSDKVSAAIAHFYHGVELQVPGYPEKVFAHLALSEEAFRNAGLINVRAFVDFGSIWSRRGRLAFEWGQHPYKGNRVQLADAIDPVFGQPQVHVRWSLSDRDVRTFEESRTMIIESLYRRGFIKDVRINHNWRRQGECGVGHHHMGTARMACRFSGGAVDSDCRLHGTNNLYLCGSAVFPTAGYANPMLTIIALSLRLAEALQQKR